MPSPLPYFAVSGAGTLLGDLSRAACLTLIDGRGVDNPLRVKRYRAGINDGLIHVRLEADGEAGTPP